MAKYPVLPGINFPLTEEKQEKVAKAADFKKSLLAARPAVPEPIYEEQYRADLENRIFQMQKRELEQTAREEKALVSDGGLDTFLGGLTNFGAGAAVGTTRMGGELASLPATAVADSALNLVPDEHRQIYAEEQAYRTELDRLDRERLDLEAGALTGKLNPEQAQARRDQLDTLRQQLKAPDPARVALLDSVERGPVPQASERSGFSVSGYDLNTGAGQQTRLSSRERIEQAKAALGFANTVHDAIARSTDGLMNPLNRERLDRDLGQSWDKHAGLFEEASAAYDKGHSVRAAAKATEGLIKLALDGGGDLFENPQATLEYVAENTPQLAVGMAPKIGATLLAGSNLAYGTRIYRDALADYQEKHNGELPSREEAARMLGWSLSATAAEHLLDSSILKSLEGAGGASVKQALQRVAVAGLEGTVGEGLTETYQQAVESNLSKLNDDFDGEELFKAGTIGAASGGTLKGGLETLNQAGEGLRAASERMQQQNGQAEQQRAAEERQQESYRSAVESGDVSALTDPQSEQYAPLRAVEALFERSQKADLPAEEKPKHAQQAYAIQTQLEERLQALKASRDQLDPAAQEQLDDLDQTIEITRQELAGLDPQGEEHGLMAEALQSFEAQRAELATLSPDTLKRRDLQIRKTEAELAGVRQRVAALDNSVRAAQPVDTAQLDSDIDLLTAETVDPQAGEAAAQRVITLAMHNPVQISDAALERLERSAHLPAEQLSYLQILRANRAAENAFKSREDVHSEVVDGSGDGQYVGINQYRQQLASALQSGDAKVAKQAVSGIRSFAADRAGKYRAAVEAAQYFAATQTPVQMIRDEASPTGFSQVFEPMDERSLREQGGFQIDARSKRYVATLREEARLTRDAAKEMEQALALGQPAAPAPSTAAAAQTASAPEAEPQANAEEGTEPASEAVELPPIQSESVALGEPQAEDSIDAELKALFAKVNAEAEAGQQTAEVEEESAPAGLLALQRQDTLLGKYVTQKNPQGRKGNPLVQRPQFLQDWLADPQLPATLLGSELTENQSNLLRYLQKALATWQDQYASILVPPQAKDAAFRYLDPIQDLMDEQGQVEDNVKTALSLAAYSGLADLAGMAALANDDWVNSAVGRDSEAEVPDTLRGLIARVGVRENGLIEALGEAAIQALSLRFSDEVPLDLAPRLAQSLGMQALQLLEQRGLIERSEVSDVELQEAMDSGVEGNERLTHAFYRPADSQAVDTIRRSLIGTQDLLGKLFGIEGQTIEPSFEPVPFTQKTAKRASEALPAQLVANIAADQARPRRIRQDMWQVVSQLDEELLYDLAGAKHLEDHVHAANVASLQAANKALIRDWQSALDFIRFVEQSENGLEQPLYLQMFAARNHRVHYHGTVLNPQTSKIHRWLLTLPEWTTTVDTGNAQSFDNFRLRVLEGLGVAADKMPNVDNLEKNWSRTVNQPEIRAAVAVLREVLAGNGMPEGGAEAIRAGVRAGGEKLHSLDALIQLAHWRLAAQGSNGKPVTFTVQTMGEVDGKTNGAMLAMLNYGTALFDELNRGGFFGKEGPQNFAQWRVQQGNLDLYESVALLTQQAMGNLKDWQKRKLPAIYAITGNLTDKGTVTKEGRNITKNPLTVLFYGAGKASTAEKMASVFVDTFYARIEEISRNGGQTKDGVTLKQLLQAANELMAFKGVPGLDVNMSIDQALGQKGTLSAEQKANLKTAFKNLVGKPLNAAVEQKFARHLQTRDSMVRTANLMFSVFDGVYQSQRQRLVDQLGIPKNGAGQPIHDLSRRQQALLLKRLGKLVPRLPMALSAGDPASGLLMAKTGKERADTADYRAEVRYWKDFKVSKKTVYGKATRYQAPGVSPLALSTQSMDSRNNSTVYAEIPALNVHDAIGTGYGQMQAAAHRLNQATFETMMEYSAPGELFNALERQLGQLVALLKSKNVAADLKQDILRNLREVYAGFQANAQQEEPDGPMSFADAVEQMNATRRSSEGTKFALLAQMEVIDQYPFEGGSYVLSDADRQLARQKGQEALDRNIDQALADAAYLDTLLGQEVEAEASEQQRRREWRAENMPEQGLPRQVSDAALVQLLEQGVQARQLIAHLQEQFQREAGNSSLQAFNAKLLSAVARLVPEDLPIRYVTAADTEVRAGENMASALAWYHRDAQGEASISVWGQDFVTSHVTPQVLLHELVHAALADVVDRAATAEVRELLGELDALRAAAAKALEGQANLQHLAPAVKDRQEFLAWGLTNPEFQVKVLARTRLEASQTEGTRLRTLWHKFVDSLSQLIFRGRSVAATNGLSLFLANSMGLFTAAHEANQEAQGSLTLAHAAPDEVLRFTTQEVLDGLPDNPNRPLDPQFRTHLGRLVSGLVGQLYGPFGAVALEARRSQALSMSDVMLKSLAEGRLPFASKALAGPFEISEAEALVLEQVEVTVNAALEGPESRVSTAQRQLERLFAEARQKLPISAFHPGDWATATPAEQALAQQRWSFLFELPPSINGRSRHLSRFAALAMAHAPTAALLGFATSPQREAVTGTLLERLVHWFHNLLAGLGQRLTHTYDGQRADARLQTLVEQLVDIEAKRRRRLATPPSKAMEVLERTGESLAEAIRKGAAKAAESPLLQYSKIPLVRAAGTTLGVWAHDRYAQLAEGLLQARNRELQKPLGVPAHLLQDFRGAMPGTQPFYRLLAQAKDLENRRQNKIAHTREIALKQFRDQGENLAAEQKTALSYFLRTDPSSLLGAYTEAQLGQLIEDPQALARAITAEKRALASAQHAVAYDIAAKKLGYFLVTGISRSEHLMLNADNIVRRYGEQQHFTDAAEIARLTPIVDRLTSLYALQYSSPMHLNQLRELWRGEQQNPNGNGVLATLKLHRALLDQAADTLFREQGALAAKGFLPEITDPHREVVTALPEEEQRLQRLGYSPGELLQPDNADPNPQTRRLYVHTSRGLRPYLSAIMSFTGKRAKGSRRKQRPELVDPTVLQLDRRELAAMRTEKFRRMARENQANASYDPRTDRTETKAVPLLNAKGEIVNYRYMMSSAQRDTLLARDNRFEQLLGQLAGSSFDKLVAPQHNRETVQALYEHFRAHFIEKPQSFAVVGANSKNPELRELWRRLPKETQQAVREVWGQDFLQVPYELLDLVFGYRKHSVSDAFEQDESEWNVLQQLTIPLLEAVFPNIGNRLRQVEDVWQEAVRLLKSIWVVRSMVTILGNIKSNLTLLFAYGITSPGELVRSHVTAFKGAWAYRQDYKAREQLQLLLDSGIVMGSTQEMEQEIRRLSDRLTRNPVRELIEAGLLPSIVEDVQDTFDPYSYQSKLMKKVEGVMDVLPDPLVTAGKWLLMTRDTPIYSMFNQTVQMSDFMGRYTLYRHLTERKSNPLSKVDAMDKAREAFIQYDIPMHRFLTYLDEMGIVPFMRFYIRIQKVIFQLFREKPARMLSLVLLGKLFATHSLITDSSMWNHINNPLQAGALNLPGAVEDITTVKAAMALLPGE